MPETRLERQEKQIVGLGEIVLEETEVELKFPQIWKGPEKYLEIQSRNMFSSIRSRLEEKHK